MKDLLKFERFLAGGDCLIIRRTDKKNALYNLKTKSVFSVSSVDAPSVQFVLTRNGHKNN